MRGDYLSRMRGYLIERTIGSLSKNEIRALEERDPVEGGDDWAPLAAASAASVDDDETDDDKEKTQRSTQDAEATMRPLLHEVWQRMISRFANSLERTATKVDASESPYVDAEEWLRQAIPDLTSFAWKLLGTTRNLCIALFDEPVCSDLRATIDRMPQEWCEALRLKTVQAVHGTIASREKPGAAMVSLAQQLRKERSPFEAVLVREAA